jgi:HD-GYP domain-containing protein (c-di-GMP phosphodiesterase class II)
LTKVNSDNFNDRSLFGPFLFRAGNSIETIIMKGLTVSLIATGGGTDVIHHHLTQGTRWAMIPEEGWDAMESIYILKGRLSGKSTQKELTLDPGDTFFANPIKEHTVFIAEKETEFLYTSSKPVFQIYSKHTRELTDFAISVEKKDGYTADHCFRIAKFSMLVGEAMKLSSNQLYDLNLGSFLHDIGKVKVPEEILTKPGKLTPEEWEIMKLHTIYGKEILLESGYPPVYKPSILVEQHHERYNGSGYPYGLKGGEIEIGAAIIAVVDSFDAMTSDRIYQKGRSKEAAIEEIKRCKGTLYQPDVVDAFLSVIDQINVKGEDEK